MASAGRNDPCPCGSGLKYKKCCLSKSEPATDVVFRQRLQHSRDELIKKILKHATKVYGPMAIEEAWAEFHQWENKGGFDPESIELQVFMPWFFYDWTPDGEESGLLDTAPVDLPPALSLLGSRKSGLDSLQSEYIEKCAQTGFSFYEILEAWPGKGFKAKDILTGEFHEIIEKSGSRDARASHIVFGKSVTINNLTTLEACSPIIIPPIYKIDIINFRQHLEEQNDPIDQSVLWEYDPEIQSLYQGIFQAVMNPKMPVMQNTDGHPLVPHRLTYEITSPQLILDALVDLSFVETRDKILSNAVYENDHLVFVEFSWSRQGHTKVTGLDNTILGNIKIEHDKLIVEVNSQRRADEFEALLKSRLKGGWKLKSRVVEPIEASLNKMRSTQKPLNDDEQKNLMKNPEIQARLTQMMKSHWDQWVFTKIPALGDVTPVEAVKTAVGRETLDALLSQFEQDADSRPIPGQGPEVFQEIRDRLGL